MTKLPACLLGACIAVLVASAPVASATTAYDYKHLCTATAKWQLTLNALGPSYATVTYTNTVCDQRITSVDSDGARFEGYSVHADQPDEQSQMVLTGEASGSVFVATTEGTGSWGRSGPVTVTGDSLTASLRGVAASGGVAHTADSHEAHTPDGTCGTDCFQTSVVWTASEDDVY